ncbi:MAG: glycoside hydrolase family 15 protein [Pseudomonadota bacterium]|nr:glycoside hydrolase family 15 protein [Pseudomonadota bacterium]
MDQRTGEAGEDVNLRLPRELLTRAAAVAQAQDGFPPINDYGLIGDCRTAALVSRDCSIEWLCLPNFSNGAVFAAILDRSKGGRFSIRPPHHYNTRRRYVGDTAVLETTFVTASGTATVTDMLCIDEPIRRRDVLTPERELLRVVEGVVGEVELEVVYAPRPNFARDRYVLRQRGALGWACESRNQLFLLHTDLPLQARDGEAVCGRFTIRAGERKYLSLSYERGSPAAMVPLGAAAEERRQLTLDFWQNWVARCTYQGPYRDSVVRSLITLKLMTFSLSGAVIAAPTASLPESVGHGRNWDYRFCWLRDAAFILRAFIDLGYPHEGAAFLDWMLHSTRLTWPRLQVLYDVFGRTGMKELTLDHLSGYRNSLPVRVGNAAIEQVQLDVYGSVLQAAHDFVRRGGKLDWYERRMLRGLGDTICKEWRLPDQGLWEMRGRPRHHTYSKLMCWCGLNCLLDLHQRGVMRVDEPRLAREREAIAAAIRSEGYSERHGAYVGEFGGDWPDAALLLLARHRFEPPDSPRLHGTFAFIEDRLSHGGLLLRYPDGEDELAGDEGAFGVCCFWAVDHMVRTGQQEAAARRFEYLLSFANDLGLFAEEIEIRTGAALGNFPQGFTHIGLISAALVLTHMPRGQAPEDGEEEQQAMFEHQDEAGESAS